MKKKPTRTKKNDKKKCATCGNLSKNLILRDGLLVHYDPNICEGYKIGNAFLDSKK